MASMMALLRSSRGNMACIFGTRRWNHVAAMPPPFDGVMERKILSPQFVLPESDRDPAQNNNIGFGFPSFLFGGSMELMAVPKRKAGYRADFSPQERHKKWPQGFETCSSDNPMQGLRALEIGEMAMSVMAQQVEIEVAAA
ncbi:unnamed protein product [Prunus armeniaca]|uniref:Uncharacterized protein n=1 Tax=Prunus armeniaca TaxID=36596 RepID=A0A6J5TDJ6_PRUAR|nr:unnamed protein product [Prunus armeniaca]